MFSSKYLAGISAALIVFVAMSPRATAGDRGKFQGHAVLGSTKFTEYKAMEGHPLKSAMTGELDGVIFHNGGGSALDRLLDRAHYHVVWVGDGAGNSYGLKTFTTKDGHKLFARADEGKATPTGAIGKVTVLGGTGPFAGIKGKGKFVLGGVSDRVFWDDIEWEWETP